MSILVLTTGGTIGAEAYTNPVHPPEFSTMPVAEQDYVIDALSKPALSKYPVRGISLEQRDSKMIDQTYLDQMIDIMGQAPERNILITHGTDRILNTSGYLYTLMQKKHPSLQNRTLILTGAMTPLANGPISDGYQNIRFSLNLFVAAQKLTKSQIYIVLSDYANNEWQAQLYPFKPGLYVKVYAADGRYHHLQKNGD